MNKIPYLQVEYIDKGTFVGGGEETSEAGIDYKNPECVVISKTNWEYIQEQLFRLEQLEK